MSTSLLNCAILLSKDIGDYWVGTTTTATGEVTIVGTSLQDHVDDWITDTSYDFITSGSYEEESRKISNASDVSAGSLTVGTHGGSIAADVTYQVHRLFSPDEKKRALLAAAQNVFGVCYDEVWDESIVSGNWLKDGSFEIWDSGGTDLTHWAESALVPARISTNGLFKHGVYSAQLAGTVGSISQSITEFDDIKFLAGQTVTFSMQAWCNTASCLRLSINDGTSITYSPYHDGGTSWTEDNPRNDNMYVQQFIDYNPTEITFGIHHAVADGTSYVDDARIIGPYQPRLYIDQLGLAQNQISEIAIEPSYYSKDEFWDSIHDWSINEDGYLYLASSIPRDYRLRIKGKQYLDFLSSGTSSESWSATINMNEPQTRILSAEAALYLYTWMSMPNYESGTREDYQNMMNFWDREATRRKGRFGMPSMPITISWVTNKCL